MQLSFYLNILVLAWPIRFGVENGERFWDMMRSFCRFRNVSANSVSERKKYMKRQDHLQHDFVMDMFCSFTLEKSKTNGTKMMRGVIG